MRILPLLFIPALAAAMACSDTATAPLAPDGPELAPPGPSALSASTDRPFAMDMTMGPPDLSKGVCYVQVPTGDPVDPYALVPIPVMDSAWGTATHMGRVTQEIWHVCDDLGFAMHDGLPAIDVGGWVVVRAANGDTVEGTWTGYIFLAGADAGAFFQTGIATGGTGRFDGATGEFTIEGWHDLANPGNPVSGWFTAEGTIAY